MNLFVKRVHFLCQMKKFVLELCVSNLEKYSDNSLVGNICLQGKDIYLAPRNVEQERSALDTFKSYLD